MIDVQQRLYVWGNNQYCQVNSSSSTIIINDDDEEEDEDENDDMNNNNNNNAYNTNNDDDDDDDDDDDNNDDNNNRNNNNEGIWIDHPQLICGNLVNILIKDVGCGFSFTMALTEMGHVYSWGCRAYCGHGGDDGGTTTNDGYSSVQATPRRIETWSSSSSSNNNHNNYNNNNNNSNEKMIIKQIAVGAGHTVALNHHGQIWTWGDGDNGRLGHGNEHDCFTPQLVQAMAHLTVQQVSCYFHTIAVIQKKIIENDNTNTNTNGGQVYSWGYNHDGQCGTGCQNNHLLPQLVRGFNNQIHVVKASCGQDHSAVLTDHGKVYCWGYNGEGQLGIGKTEESCVLLPRKVDKLDELIVWDVSCGTYHTLAYVDPASLPPNDAKPITVANHLMVNNPDSYPDFTFFVDGETVLAHRGILSQRSLYFANLFRSPMQEANDGIATIPDMERKHFVQVLDYLYSGYIIIALEDAVELYIAADRFCLDELKQLCSSSFTNQLSVATVAFYLRKTDTMMCHDLKTKCFKFIVKHFKEVIQLGDNTQVHLSLELLWEICKVMAER